MRDEFCVLLRARHNEFRVCNMRRKMLSCSRIEVHSSYLKPRWGRGSVRNELSQLRPLIVTTQLKLITI